jgi:hypothetical protein
VVDEREDLAQQLWDIEQIKQLKARYFRLLDTKSWDQWAELFTEDAELQYPVALEGGTPRVLRGREELRAGPRQGHGPAAVTVHHGHTPEIQLRPDGTAHGIWAMFDFVDRPGDRRQGYGHYYEEYIKDGDGQWRIRRSRLERLRVDFLPPAPGA